MDKLIHNVRDVQITNDGATILQLLDIVHPAAKTLVDIANSQDNEVGDGTTSVTLMAGELLMQSKGFIEEGMHPQIIISGYRQALRRCIQQINEVSVKLSDDEGAKRKMLMECAKTSLNSKLIAKYKDFFSEMVVDAVESLPQRILDKNFIGIKKVTGGSVKESFLVKGVAFKKTFSYAGFEQ